jgi:chromosome segregation ATPase
MMLAIFSTWRTEIGADLDAARLQLATEQEAVTEAEVGASAAKAERRTITEAAARLHPHVSIAGALAMRLRDHEDRMRQADGRVLQARNAAKSTHARIKDLEDALVHLDVMAPPAAEPALLVLANA